MVRFSFAGVEFVALPQGALYWPARRALLVADLHFEKASWFAAHGQLLPPYDSIATIADLAVLIDALAVEERGAWAIVSMIRMGPIGSMRMRPHTSGA